MTQRRVPPVLRRVLAERLRVASDRRSPFWITQLLVAVVVTVIYRGTARLVHGRR